MVSLASSPAAIEKGRIMLPVSAETVGAEEFLKIFGTSGDNIEQVSVVPPVLGTRFRGRLRVKYRTPVLRHVSISRHPKASAH